MKAVNAMRQRINSCVCHRRKPLRDRAVVGRAPRRKVEIMNDSSFVSWIAVLLLNASERTDAFHTSHRCAMSASTMRYVPSS